MLIMGMFSFFPCFLTASFRFLNPFPKQQILDSFKLNVFADDKFKLDEDGKKFYRQVETSVGKGEIAYTADM